jgi:hypothetical protein
MSIIAKIPDNSRVRYPVVRFRSSDLDGSGQYAWENAGNKDVTLLDNLNAQNVYLIERVNFYANVSQTDWLESMNTPANFPRVLMAFNRIGPSSLFAEPWRCVNYVDNSEQLLYFQPLQKADRLTASMFGVSDQTPGMVGKLNLLAQINFTVYEITDRDWIRTYQQNPPRVGATLRI